MREFFLKRETPTASEGYCALDFLLLYRTTLPSKPPPSKALFQFVYIYIYNTTNLLLVRSHFLNVYKQRRSSRWPSHLLNQRHANNNNNSSLSIFSKKSKKRRFVFRYSSHFQDITYIKVSTLLSDSLHNRNNSWARVVTFFSF